MFELFGYLEQTQGINPKGIGLGLHICKQIVEQFDGHIICKSEWKKGTNFIFLIALNQ